MASLRFHEARGGGDRPGAWYIDRGDRGSAVAALRLGLDLEITHIDTAELYGDADEVVAEAITGRREDPRAAGRCGRRTISSISSWRTSGSRRAAWRSCAMPRRGA